MLWRWSYGVAPSGAGLRSALFTGGCPAAQIRRPAESTGWAGPRSGASRQTTTGTNALEVDMPPRHQRDAVGEDAGGGHVANCATDTDICPNRGRFALRVSKSPLGNWSCDGPNGSPRTARPRAERRAGRSASISTCRSARPAAGTATSTPTRPPNWAARIPTVWLVARAAPSWSWRRTLLGVAVPRCETVFVGGGTPSLLGGAGLAAVLDAVREHFVLARGAEVTTEANPESTSPELFAQLRDAGYTRVSLGMQSVGPARAGHAGPGAFAGSGARRGPRGPRGRVRTRQHRPHLRHAGGVRRRPAPLGRRRGRAEASITSRPTR